MVGGFVEKKHVGPGGEHARKLRPFPPAAGKLPDGELPLVLHEAEAGKHRLRALFGVVAVARFQIVLPGHEAVHGSRIPRLLRLFPLVPEIAPVGQGILHPFQKRYVQRSFVQYLFHITHAALARNDDAPAVRRSHARQHAQKRGFARAVGAAYAKTHAVHDIQRKIVEDIAAAVRLGKILNGDVHGMSPGREPPGPVA